MLRGQPSVMRNSVKMSRGAFSFYSALMGFQEFHFVCFLSKSGGLLFKKKTIKLTAKASIFYNLGARMSQSTQLISNSHYYLIDTLITS